MTACLYVMGMPGGPVKVGSCKSAEARLYQIRREEANESIVVLRTFEIEPRWALAAERYVHWQLREHHFRREWFHVTARQAASAIKRAVGHNYDLMANELIPPLVPRGRKRK